MASVHAALQAAVTRYESRTVDGVESDMWMARGGRMYAMNGARYMNHTHLRFGSQIWSSSLGVYRVRVSRCSRRGRPASLLGGIGSLE